MLGVLARGVLGLLARTFDFRTGHRDSMGGSKTYRGGSAQWMRTGAGAQHEEFWETSDERRTSIELFQIWVNLPASQKFDPPSIRYLGAAHGAPWHEEVVDGTRIRTVLDENIVAAASVGDGATPNRRPRAEVLHAWIPAGGAWNPKVGADSSCSLYCREGQVTVPGPGGGQVTVKAGESCGFAPGADAITCANAARGESDVLLLVGERLREPVAMGGPIVMNYDWEIDEAYRELQAGTFLKRSKS